MASFLELPLCIHVQRRGHRRQPSHEASVGISHLSLLVEDHGLEQAAAACPAGTAMFITRPSQEGPGPATDGAMGVKVPGVPESDELGVE